MCGGGVWCACTIQLDGQAVASCLTPATALRDAAVTTVEGLADGEDLHPPLPETGYKVELIAATVRHTLEQLLPTN